MSEERVRLREQIVTEICANFCDLCMAHNCNSKSTGFRCRTLYTTADTIIALDGLGVIADNDRDFWEFARPTQGQAIYPSKLREWGWRRLVEKD